MFDYAIPVVGRHSRAKFGVSAILVRFDVGFVCTSIAFCIHRELMWLCMYVKDERPTYQITLIIYVRKILATYIPNCPNFLCTFRVHPRVLIGGGPEPARAEWGGPESRVV